MNPAQLPSTFYRVTAKALIFDDQHRLLVVGRHGNGVWQTPGGGWEHNESFEDCLKREVQEELGVAIDKTGPPQFVFRARSKHGWYTIRIVVTATVKSHDFAYGDGMVEAKFITREEFQVAQFEESEEGILDHATDIWNAPLLK